MVANKQIFQYLVRLPHFRLLPRDDLAALAGSAKIREYTDGEGLALRDHTEIDHLYIVASGCLSHFQDKPGQRSSIATSRKGDVFGSISLLMNGGVSVRSAHANGAALCYLIPKEMFLDLCVQNETFHDAFLEQNRKRLFTADRIEPMETAARERFLMDVTPFSFLPENEIEMLANRMAVIRHPRDILLFRQEKSRIGYLYILKTGSAELSYAAGDKETVGGLLTGGEVYGGVSLVLNSGIAMRTLKVKKDSEFYLLPKRTFLDLCKRYEIVYQCLLKTDNRPVLCHAIIARSLQTGNDARQLYRHPVKTLCSPVTRLGHGNMTIRQAAMAMRHDKSRFLLIEDPARRHHGMITESDLARKVVAGGMDTAGKVKRIMSPLISVSQESPVFEALMTMVRKDVERLAVTDNDGRLIGVVSNRDLSAVQEHSPVFLLRQIANAQDMKAIVDKQEPIARVIRSLIENGADAKNVTRMVTMLSDAILNKLIRFTIKALGNPPSRFVFLLMGSEGRREQTLKTDQDNALLFEDRSPDSETERDYFLKFGEITCDFLNQAGYAFCQGDVMAMNPKWCQPLSVWKGYFSDWIHAAQPENLLQASIFFDFRGGFGDPALTARLRDHLFGSLGGWPGFFWHLAENALHYKPPLGLFGNFFVASKGPHRDAFDIKMAMMLIVDFARIYALKHRIPETNTWDRLEMLHLAGVLSQQEYEELDKAYSVLMQLRFQRQVESVIDKKVKPDNYVYPNNLTTIEQTTLKRIFRNMQRFQAKMRFDFTGS